MKIPLKVNADFLDVRRAASLKAGGTGLRYICRICGRTVALFNAENKWFMEK